MENLNNRIKSVYVEADDFLKVISNIVIYLIIRKNVFFVRGKHRCRYIFYGF